MKKIEIIWREILFCAIEKKNRQFTQKEVAAKFGFSTSTVFQALKIPRKVGAIRVTGRFFTLEDTEKLLYCWASVRDIDKDIKLTTHVDLTIPEIEARMPADIVFGGFTAAREILGGNVPADYDMVHVYAPNLTSIQKRFEFGKTLSAGRQGRANLFVLPADKFLASYGQITTIAQTFVDLWNLPVWYANEFTKSLKAKIDEFLP